MSMNLDELVKYCNDFLNISSFSDSSQNGLQVEGKKEISKIITGVSACKELFEEAVKESADAILVHHGLLWGESMSITGIFKDRIKLLLDNNISLLAYHLPLDTNDKIGNNIIIANKLKLKKIESFFEYNNNKIGFKGELNPLEFESFINVVDKELGPIKTYVKGGIHKVNRIGICSGGASKDVDQAYLENLDTYVTGEIGEPTKAFAEEANIHYIALGHYNSEIYGIKALGELVKKQFNIEVEFIKLDNPN